MATRKRKKHQIAALKLRDLACHLADYRVVKLECERFFPPEESPRGTFKLESSSSIDLFKPSPNKAKQFLVMRSELDLTGTRVVQRDGKSVEDTPSFRILLISEGLFDHNGPELTTTSEFDEEVFRRLISEVYPLAMLRIREVAADMGYTGVRPKIGFDHEEPLSDEAPQAEKVALQETEATNS